MKVLKRKFPSKPVCREVLISAALEGISDRGSQSGNNHRKRNFEKWGCLPVSHQPERSLFLPKSREVYKTPHSMAAWRKGHFAERTERTLLPWRKWPLGGSGKMGIWKLANRGGHSNCSWGGSECWNSLLALISRKGESNMRLWYKVVQRAVDNYQHEKKRMFWPVLGQRPLPTDKDSLIKLSPLWLGLDTGFCPCPV